MFAIKNNKKWILLVIILAFILFFVIVSWLSLTEEKQPIEAENYALIVEKIYPQPYVWQQEIIADGLIQPTHEARLSSQLSGLKVNRLWVDVGTVVKQNDILAEFETELNQAELQQLNASVAESQAQYDESLRHFKRLKQLQTGHLVSEQEFKQAQVSMLASQSRLQAAQAAFKSGEIRIRQTNLVAPADGVISERNISPGSIVTAGEPLFKLIVDNRLEWQAELMVKQLAFVKAGHQVEVLLDNDLEVSGIVRQISPRVSNNNTVMVYVTLLNPPLLVAGDFVRGKFLMPAQAILALPASAVIQRDGFDYVLKITADNHVQETKVSAVVVQQRIMILDGIADTDAIVLAGGEFLKNGDRVKIVNPEAQP